MGNKKHQFPHPSVYLLTWKRIKQQEKIITFDEENICRENVSKGRLSICTRSCISYTSYPTFPNILIPTLPLYLQEELVSQKTRYKKKKTEKNVKKAIFQEDWKTKEESP